MWLGSALVGGLLFSMRTVFVLPLIVWGLYQLFHEKVQPLKLIGWGVVFLLAFAFTFLPFIVAYPHDFWEINPFLIQSTLVPSIFIAIFVVLPLSVASFATTTPTSIFSVLYSCLVLSRFTSLPQSIFMDSKPSFLNHVPIFHTTFSVFPICCLFLPISLSLSKNKSTSTSLSSERKKARYGANFKSLSCQILRHTHPRRSIAK